MKNLISKTLLASTLICSAGTAVFAAEDESKFTAGIKLGILDIDEGSSDMAYGIAGGYKLYEGGSLSIEALGNDVDIDTTSLSVYYAYRSTGEAYFLGKIGATNIEAKASLAGQSVSESDTGLSYGLGGGYRFSENFAAELEYTVLDQDASFVGVTAQFSF